MSETEPKPKDFVLRIALVKSENSPDELEPSVWRRVKVSAHLKLDVFADKVITPVMGWVRNYHTYVFSTRGKKWLYQDTNAPDLMHASMRYSSETLLDPKNTTLGQVLKKVGDKISYTYDLGDNWYHMITVEDILEGDKADGKCEVLGGEMRCPDEDGEGCNTYQENVLDLVLKLRRNPNDHSTARELAKNCFDLRNGLNVRGRFDPNEFDVKETQAAVKEAFKSRGSAMVGTKQFTSEHSPFGGKMFCPVYPGQRLLTTMVEDDRFGDGFLVTMTETINIKPDDRSNTACLCGNPLVRACSACQSVCYCSVDCQRQDWNSGHKAICKTEKKKVQQCKAEGKTWSTKKPDDLERTGETIPLRKTRDTLRFKKGDTVECMVGENIWATGVIVDTHYKVGFWPESRPRAPYQILLAQVLDESIRDANRRSRDDIPDDVELDNRLIFSIWDDDYQIRKLPNAMPVPAEIRERFGLDENNDDQQDNDTPKSAAIREMYELD